MTTTPNEIDLADIERLATSESPDLADSIAAFVRQPDTKPEKVPSNALTPDSVLWQLNSRSRYAGSQARRKTAHEIWQRFLAQTDPPLPQRFQLADFLVNLYERGGDTNRASLVDLIVKAPLRFGLWAGLKRIYKLAEARMDAEMFGVLAWRFDAELARSSSGPREVSAGTLVYLRRRAWRFLRQLGASLPELYPQFAVQVLRHYGIDTYFDSVWIANHVWAHTSKKFTSTRFVGRALTDLVKHRAFDDTWKRSADPLMFLLEVCQADMPARFAIQSLRKDFPDKLRSVTPAWLDRLSRRPLGGIHEFLVETLQGSPEFHQGKLKSLGLHETVLSLLVSPSEKARAYAIEYARAHAQDMASNRLADLVETAPNETKKFAVELLQRRTPRDLGHVFLGRLVGLRETNAWAVKALSESFDRTEIPTSFLTDMVFGNDSQRNWVPQYFSQKYQANEIDVGFWRNVLDDPRQKNNYQATQLATNNLGKFPPAAIGAEWLLAALQREDANIAQAVSRWLSKADNLPGLDIEKVKGLVFNPQYRPLALGILGNHKLVKPKDLSLPWLLALARRPDPSLHEFAQRYLLENMKPADFSEDADKDAGTTRLFALATGEREPEPVRTFAQTYLRCHHPVVGPEQTESKQLSLKPQLPRKAYTAERVWPGLWDMRADVRRFAVVVTRAELREWNRHNRVYELAESEAKEVRNVAYDALLKAGTPNADAAMTLKPEELDADKIFALTESLRRPTRDVGMEMIRRHYAKLGGASRLGWIMGSPDREVRQFAVQLLWEKHRPRPIPEDWKPNGKGTPLDAPIPFEDDDALRDFLRRILYGLPPGRSMDPTEEVKTRRRIPASVAKRNVIEIVRDMGLQEGDFARLVAPVLREFTASLARGEWQACLAALVQLRATYPDIQLGGVN